MDGKLIRSNCGAILTEENAQNFEGTVLCDTCFADCTVECDDCHERIWADDAEGDENHVLCTRCYDYYYTHCENCGRLIHNDDAYYEDDEDYPYCHSCFCDMGRKPIKNYSYKPEPIMYGEGTMYYGVELEMDGEPRLSPEECAVALIEVANKDGEKIYIKRDGSLSSWGIEVVTHPATIDAHLNKIIDWDGILRTAVELGFTSHDNGRCGLHVHASKSGFGNGSEREEAIGRLVFFFEKHWNELVKLSRRTPTNLERWAARYATISNTTEETYNKAKEKRMGRYVAVNLENHNTVEIRLWRGSLRKNTVLATLQLVDEIIKCVKNSSNKEIEEMTWSEFVMGIPEERIELIEYLKSKRLYVNALDLQEDERERSEV